MFPFSKNKIKRKQTVWRNKKFREDGWNLKDHNCSRKETSKRLTKHHEPKDNAQKKLGKVNLKKVRLINDVRY